MGVGRGEGAQFTQSKLLCKKQNKKHSLPPTCMADNQICSLHVGLDIGLEPVNDECDFVQHRHDDLFANRGHGALSRRP